MTAGEPIPGQNGSAPQEAKAPPQDSPMVQIDKHLTEVDRLKELQNQKLKGVIQGLAEWVNGTMQDGFTWGSNPVHGNEINFLYLAEDGGKRYQLRVNGIGSSSPDSFNVYQRELTNVDDPSSVSDEIMDDYSNTKTLFGTRPHGYFVAFQAVGYDTSSSEYLPDAYGEDFGGEVYQRHPDPKKRVDPVVKAGETVALLKKAKLLGRIDNKTRTLVPAAAPKPVA